MSIVAVRCRKHNREQQLPLEILQFVRGDDGTKASRRLTALNREIIKGPWNEDRRPFKTGLYCVHCLNEGKREPLPVDVEDWPDLGLADRPVVFLDPRTFRAAEWAKAMRERFPSVQMSVHELQATSPVHGGQHILDQLRPELTKAIRRQIVGPNGLLYKFQGEAIEAALNGHDVVVTTPTASGKTLTYLTPILNELLEDRGATALYLSPLVALTEDQLESITQLDDSGTDWEVKGQRFSHYRVCRELKFGERSVMVARYDGQVSAGDRQHIRRVRPQYVLTTPDMLHVALLNGAFNEKQWRYFFAGLKFVVIDELHTYKGVFGAAFANVVRRLLRICRAHGSNPQFLCASATIQEPKETVEKLIGRTPKIIDGRNGAPQQQRMFVLWSNQVDGDPRALSTQAKDVLLFTLLNRIRTIAFGRSISEINDIYRFVSAELREVGHDEISVTPFMRELRRDEKRQIISQLKQGTVHGVISTTALSLGIDIGSLSAAVIIGFPGSIAELWQQAGRAGRAGEGLIVLIADNGPLDQFFVNHPQVLFDLNAEPVYLNPDNPFVVRGHLLCAARERPLRQEEIAGFGQAAEKVVRELLDQEQLEWDPDTGQFTLSEALQKEFPSVSLRNLSFSIDVMTDDDKREVIVQVDAARAQRALHKYARYQHVNRYYEVTRFDVDFDSQRGQIFARELERTEYITTPLVENEVVVIEQVRHYRTSACEFHYGQVRSKTDVKGYYRVPLFARNEPFQYQHLGVAAPPSLTYDTYGIWITLDSSVCAAYPVEEMIAGIYSLTEAIRLATAIEELCDPSDLGAVGYARRLDIEQPQIMIYDATPGSIGITEAAFPKIDRILQRALFILDECPYCSKHPESRGCPYCVTARYGDESTINRHVAIEIVRKLIQG